MVFSFVLYKEHFGGLESWVSIDYDIGNAEDHLCFSGVLKEKTEVRKGE